MGELKHTEGGTGPVEYTTSAAGMKHVKYVKRDYLDTLGIYFANGSPVIHLRPDDHAELVRDRDALTARVATLIAEVMHYTSGTPHPDTARVAELEKERYSAILAMRCAMGADHDGVAAMRWRLEPVVAKYGSAVECQARAALSEFDAQVVENEFCRSLADRGKHED